MPLITEDQSISAQGATMSGIAQPGDEEKESPYSGLDLAAAALRQNNVVSNAPQLISDAVASFDDVYDPNFDPLSDDQVAGYEQFADRFIDSRSSAESQRIKERINTELEDREVIRQAGWGGVAASIAAGAIDPVTIASMAVPLLGTGSRGARILQGVNASIGLDSAQEAILHQEQSLRTLGESAINVGAGALLTGALGRLATRISKKDFGGMTEEVRRWTDGIAPSMDSVESTAGAARVGFGTSIEEESVAKGGQSLLKALGFSNPLARVMQAKSKRARILMQEIADVPFLLNKHLQGVATPRSAEGAIKAEQATRYRLINETDAAWREHKLAGGKLARGEFAEQVAGALRRGDKHPNAAVEKVAQSYRKYFDESRKALQDNDLIPDPVKIDQAKLEEEAVESYFKVQEKQLFTDYLARTRAAINEGRAGVGGDAVQAGDAAGRIQSELERALAVSTDIRDTGLSDSAARVETAQETYDAAVSAARRDLDGTFEAARKEAELALDATGEANRNVADQLALGTDVAKHVRTLSIEKAEAMLEAAQREHQKLSRKVRSELPLDKARIEILKSKLGIEAVRREVAKAIQAARKEYTAVTAKLKAQNPKAELPAKSDRATNRSLREFRRAQASARRELEAARKAEERVARQERRRFLLASRGAKKTAMREIDKIEVAGLDDFRKRATNVASGETDADPAVNELAKLVKDREGGKLASRVAVPKTRVTQAPVGAKSYLPRLWDHQKIRSNRIAFEAALRDWFGRSHDIAPEEVDAAVADVIDTVNGSLRDHAQIATGFVGKTGSLKSRTLNVPDEILEPWLVNDIEKIMDSYIRTVTPQLVLKKKFGDLDMRQQMQDVRDEYVAMRERAKTDKAKAAVTDEMEKVLADIQAVRDLLMNRYGKPADPDSLLVKTGRLVRSWNYIRSLGGQVFSSFPDAGRIVSRHGLVKTTAKIGRLITDSKLRNLTKAEAHRVGTALEWVLNTRGDTLAEIGDEMVTSRLDRVMRRESNRFSRVTGMASWNSALKTLAVGLEQDAIVRAAKGGKLSKFQTGQLASLGIGERMTVRIGKQINDHAVDADGLFRANTEAWADREAADAFEGALLKSADQFVLTKGVADVPLFMSKDMGKTLFQFKSFGMAAVNRLLIPMAQGLAHGDIATINGAWMMLALGALANTARDYAAGYKPVTDPTRIAIEAFDRAGFTAFMAEPLDYASSMFGGPRFGRFTSQSPEEQLVGPAIGAAFDVTETVRKAFTKGDELDPELKADDVYRFRKLLPYQNLFYLRRLVNALEGEFSEGIGAEGAGAKSFAERVTETKELNRN